MEWKNVRKVKPPKALDILLWTEFGMFHGHFDGLKFEQNVDYVNGYDWDTEEIMGVTHWSDEPEGPELP